MEIAQLKYFIQVAEYGSFSRAAAALEVAQPFLSRQIRRLEVELHKHLFYRHGRGILLTDSGRHFLQTAQCVVQQLERAAKFISVSDNELTGHFSLGIPPSLTRGLAVPLLRSFTERFPRARLAVVEGLSRNLSERLLAQKLDAALLHDPAASQLMLAEPLSTENMCLISRKGTFPPEFESVKFGSLADLQLVFPSRPHPLRSIVEIQAAKSGVSLNFAHDIDGVETILELIQEGFGHTIASATVVRLGRYRETLSALPIVEPEMASTITLATAQRQPPTPLHQMTLDMVREIYKGVAQSS